MNRDVPKQYSNIYKRAMGGNSRKAAMHAFCAECVGWVSKEIKLCSDTGCPLYPYRPNLDDSDSPTQSKIDAMSDDGVKE